MNSVDKNPMELLHRLESLERQMGVLNEVQGEQGTVVQQIVEDASEPILYEHQNMIRNGDLDFDRNRYLYTVDFAGGTGEDQNVSQEAAHIFAHPKDAQIESTGDITTGTNTLTINDALFIAGDVGKNIVVHGAGAAGANLETTIAGFTSTTQVTLTNNAGTTVNDALVRWRMVRLLEDSTDIDADANLATNTALKTPTHTRYATTVSNPDYDRTNGWIRWSESSNTLTFPLPFNYITPSKQYILSFVYRLVGDVDGFSEVFMDLSAGLWDNTAGERRFIEGATSPTLSGAAVGTTGATSRDYFVVMYMSDGRSVGTTVLTIANTNATIDSTNYVELSWPQPPGIVRSEIYRLTGATYVRLLPPFPASTYYDKGQISNTEVGFPVTDLKRFRAYTKLTEANFSPAKADAWQLGQMNIVVPSDYDTSKTTGIQWLVIELGTTISGTGSDRALQIDLISLDDKFGIFSKCALDMHAKRGRSTAATSGNQGTSGGGGGGVPPGGGGHCPTFDEFIETDRGKVRAIDLVDHEDEYKILNISNLPVKYTAVVRPPQVVYTLIAGDYKIKGSETHRVFENYSDTAGKRLQDFQKGDTILTRQGLATVEIAIRHFTRKHVVEISLQEGQEKGYWQNDVGVHNLKLPGEV